MNASRYLIALLLAIALSISGCGLLTDNSVDVDIRTDANSYVAAPGNSIMLTTINRSSEPLYFACYGWIDLQQVDGGRVIRSWYISGAEQCGVVTLEEGDSTVRQYLFDQNSNLESIADASYDSALSLSISLQPVQRVSSRARDRQGRRVFERVFNGEDDRLRVAGRRK